MVNLVGGNGLAGGINGGLQAGETLPVQVSPKKKSEELSTCCCCGTFLLAILIPSAILGGGVTWLNTCSSIGNNGCTVGALGVTMIGSEILVIEKLMLMSAFLNYNGPTLTTKKLCGLVVLNLAGTFGFAGSLAGQLQGAQVNPLLIVGCVVSMAIATAAIGACFFSCSKNTKADSSQSPAVVTTPLVHANQVV